MLPCNRAFIQKLKLEYGWGRDLSEIDSLLSLEDSNAMSHRLVISTHEERISSISQKDPPPHIRAPFDPLQN